MEAGEEPSAVFFAPSVIAGEIGGIGSVVFGKPDDDAPGVVWTVLTELEFSRRQVAVESTSNARLVVHKPSRAACRAFVKTDFMLNPFRLRPECAVALLHRKTVEFLRWRHGNLHWPSGRSQSAYNARNKTDARDYPSSGPQACCKLDTSFTSEAGSDSDFFTAGTLARVKN